MAKQNGLSKRASKRKARKERKQALREQEQLILQRAKELELKSSASAEPSSQGTRDQKFKIVTEDDPLANISEDDPMAAFKNVLSKFAGAEELVRAKEDARKSREADAAESEVSTVKTEGTDKTGSVKQEKGAGTEDDEDEDGTESEEDYLDSDEEENRSKLSRKELKDRRQQRLERLKRTVRRPEVVETHDANSHDPETLVFLKACKNTVPVPSHWSQKRKYLQNKRGHEMVIWELPKFIADTGIAAQRTAHQDKVASMTMKQKQRAMMRPKAVGVEIDYNVLHDAFFRYQTKPRVTDLGELYYEGKEFEVRKRDLTPGILSEGLMAALGMRNKDKSPVPWLGQMQRWGPPPAYPQLRVPGVNAAIPIGARWGNGPDEWGKPPLDMYGQPLFGGDVYGSVQAQTEAEGEPAPEAEEELWGMIIEESEGESEEDTDEEEEDEDVDMEEGSDEDASEGEAEDASGTVSTLAGLETPDAVQLRKQDALGTATPIVQLHKHAPPPVPAAEEAPPAVPPPAAAATSAGAPRPLYTVLEEKDTSVGGDGLVGSSRKYVIPEQPQQVSEEEELRRRMEAQRRSDRGEVAINISPDELAGLDEETLKRKYQAQLAAEKMGGGYKQGIAAASQERAAKRAKLAEDHKSSLKKIF